MSRKILHLVDDATPGGVTRMLSHIEASPLMAQNADHAVRVIPRGKWSAPRSDADLVVSHLSVSWRNMPMMMALRALHPITPLVHVEHSYSEAFVSENVSNRDRFMTLLRSSYALFDRVVAVSQGQAAWLGRTGVMRNDMLRVIQPSVDLCRFLSLTPSTAEHPRAFGAIGRLDRQKGFDILIDAFRAANVEDSRLLVIGDGPERRMLEKRAAGDPRIEFRGFSSEPWRAMADCDAVVMPSRWEPFGLVALEAQAAGRMVICAELDGLCDHVPGGALTVRGASAEAWSAALRGAARLDLRSHAERARLNAAQHEAHFANGWAALIEELSGSQTELQIAC